MEHFCDIYNKVEDLVIVSSVDDMEEQAEHCTDVNEDDDELKHVDVSSKIELYQQRIRRFSDFNLWKNIKHCDPNNNNHQLKSKMIKRRSKSLPSTEPFVEIVPKEDLQDTKVTMNNNNNQDDILMSLQSDVGESSSKILPSVKLLAEKFSTRKGYKIAVLIIFTIFFPRSC